jgi:hypothetical protein
MRESALLQYNAVQCSTMRSAAVQDDIIASRTCCGILFDKEGREISPPYQLDGAHHSRNHDGHPATFRNCEATTPTSQQ